MANTATPFTFGEYIKLVKIIKSTTDVDTDRIEGDTNSRGFSSVKVHARINGDTIRTIKKMFNVRCGCFLKNENYGGAVVFSKVV